MFDYNSSETIINGLYLPDGTTPQWRVLSKVADPSAPPVQGEDPLVNYFGGNKALEVTRVAKYVDKFITQIYRNPYVAPVMEVATGTVPTGGIAAGVVYRLVIDVILTQGSQSAEYARWSIHKGKPFYLEARSLTSISNTTNAATELVKQFNLGLKKANIDEKDLTITSNAATILVTAKSEFVRFKFIAIETKSSIGSGPGEDLEGDPANYFIQFDASTATPAEAKFVISTPGVEGFGTYNYMISNLRIPTVEQTRFAGIFQDQAPIPGAKYTQFSLTYTADRKITGTQAVGGKTTSETTHVFYILDTGVNSNANPAYKFWADVATVVINNNNLTNVPASNAANVSATNDGILESLIDNPPIVQ